ncbi:MAG: hypothetical protein C0483_17630 [Pirellula sp.]|nr:hypothetical protein [Pirellula sp.]
MIQRLLEKIKQFALQTVSPATAGKLRAWRHRRMVRAFVPRVVEHVYGGGPLKVYIADPLSQGWYDADWEQLPEIKEMKQSRLRAGAMVFNLGAHQAVVAMMLAREVGSTGRVIAVEASKHNAEVARRNVDLNDLPQIEVLHCAVSNFDGRLCISEALNCRIDDGTGSLGRQEVESVTIDTLAQRFGMPDVVFLDVEGAESMALAGAQEVLASGADFFVEVHVGCGLEQLGSGVAQLLASFPHDRYTFLVRGSDEGSFRPAASNDEVFRERFFLLARAQTSPSKSLVTYS